ncbi:MAG: hypothetical protein JW767_04610, partial [Thermoleophilia bacterium]|nr:hypothetical protein [Thermoleophilia bacterium]
LAKDEHLGTLAKDEHLGTLAKDEHLGTLARHRAEAPVGVTWFCSWRGTGDAVTCSDREAPNAEVVVGVLEKSGVPYEVVREVRQPEPEAGGFVAFPPDEGTPLFDTTQHT